MRVHDFPKGISQKVNVIALLVFEFIYYGVTVQNVCHYTTKTPSQKKIELTSPKKSNSSE